METKKIPYHLGIIMDGNRRWAKEKGLPVFIGHKKGLETVQKVIKWAKDKGIKVLTLFAFSTENWQRPEREVNFLMGLTKKALNRDSQKYTKEGIRVQMIGQRERLPKEIQKSLKEIEELTKNNEVMTLNIALSYGGRAEIAEAIKNIIKKKIPPEKITEKVVSQNLWTSDLDLLIRTGKEQRLSNFLIWQAAYSELYFCKKYWPDFSEEDFDEALISYTQRQRKFGQ